MYSLLFALFLIVQSVPGDDCFEVTDSLLQHRPDEMPLLDRVAFPPGNQTLPEHARYLPPDGQILEQIDKIYAHAIGIYKITVPIKGLPTSFEGYKIVQVSDMHIGPLLGREHTERVKDLVNNLEADMVAITGDLLDGYPKQIKDDLEPIAHIKAHDGIFFVPGNHEYRWDYPTWRTILKEWGMRIQENASYAVTKGDERLIIAGIPDQAATNFGESAIDLDTAMNGILPSDRKILLAHQPIPADGDYGVDLQLSGHTHGSRFTHHSTPWNPQLWKYYIGLNKVGKAWLYINRATGYWRDPTRGNGPLEITLIELIEGF